MSVVTATISHKTMKVMPATYEVMSLDIEREVNRIPRCSVKLLDGDLAQSTFPISDTAFFEPGAELTVSLRYGDEPDVIVFVGLVVRHGLSLSRRGSILSVELKDKALALTRPRKSVLHPQDSSDADVIQTIASDGGLTVTKVATTAPAKHLQLVQYDVSDWDFILTRAEAQGLVLAVTDGALTVAEVAAKGATTHTFEYGKDDLYSVDVEADGLYQPGAVESVGWDDAEQAITAKTEAKAAKSPIGDLDAEKVATALGIQDTALRHLAPLDPKELAAWADGHVARARMSMVRGRLSIPGTGAPKLLDAIKLVGMGKRFTGASTITGIRHRVTKAGWTTDLQLGFSPELLVQQDQVSAPPAAGLLPGIRGLQVGVVSGFEEDPAASFRVKVLVPSIDPTKGLIWARLASPDAGVGRGFFFRPETGDEVIVGFINGDPRQAVILGSLYSKKNAPPDALKAIDADNFNKGIVSRTGVTFGVIDEDKPVAYIQTPGKQGIVFDDSDGTVVIADSNGNSITLDDGGITITSAKDVTIDGSGGNVTILGTKVEVK